MVAEGAQRLTLFRAGAGQGGGAVGRGFEEHRGLAADDLHVDFFGGAGVADLRQLQYFAFGNDARCLGDDAHHRHGIQFHHHFERAGI